MSRSVFLDIDGVLTDHALLHADFNALLGEVLAPALGGTVEDWGRANAATFPRVFEELQGLAGPGVDPRPIFDTEYRVSVHAMCDWLGIPRPSDDEAIRLGRAYTVHVRGNTGALFPAASDMVRTLSRDHDLHLATGNPSWVAEALLERMGVRDLVDFPCGPDLIGVWKAADTFHTALFEAVGVEPQDAIVVDDAVPIVANARAAGATTVLVTTEPVEEGVADVVVTDPAEVVEAVSRLASRPIGQGVSSWRHRS